MEDKSSGTIKNLYLNRYASKETLISDSPNQELRIIVTIPCFNEPDLISTLVSIDKCRPVFDKTEVIVLINDADGCSKDIKAQNQKSKVEALEWIKTRENSSINFHIVYKEDLPKKHAGVGLARKLAMDEAVKRFESIGQKDGIIACFDADSLCDPSYLQSLSEYFTQYPKSPGCSIYYEHPLTGHLSSEIYEAITDYELFLRYYTNALSVSKFPYAYQTVGSSMAVRSWAYQKQGGMPRRKAGEDFHFINKIIPLNHFGEINTTRVIPSPRVSDRVPFGTGKAVNDWLQSQQLLTYNPKTFEDLGSFFSSIDNVYDKNKEAVEKWCFSLPDSIKGYLKKINYKDQIERINKNSTSLIIFKKHFYHWFDAFQCMKFIHYARDHFYANVPISDGAKWLLRKGLEESDGLDNKELLLKLRSLDQKEHFRKLMKPN